MIFSLKYYVNKTWKIGKCQLCALYSGKKPLINHNTQKSGAHKIKTFATWNVTEWFKMKWWYYSECVVQVITDYVHRETKD